MIKEEEKEWANVYCPVCTAKGGRGLVCKIKTSLLGKQFIELKCKSCKQLVRVP